VERRAFLRARGHPKSLLPSSPSPHLSARSRSARVPLATPVRSAQRSAIRVQPQAPFWRDVALPVCGCFKQPRKTNSERSSAQPGQRSNGCRPRAGWARSLLIEPFLWRRPQAGAFQCPSLTSGANRLQNGPYGSRGIADQPAAHTGVASGTLAVFRKFTARCDSRARFSCCFATPRWREGRVSPGGKARGASQTSSTTAIQRNALFPPDMAILFSLGIVVD
jgi:hypothetical protein